MSWYAAFFEFSEEDGGAAGLGILKGKVKELKPNKNLKVPNIGWKEIIIDKPGILLYVLRTNQFFTLFINLLVFQRKNIIKSKLTI